MNKWYAAIAAGLLISFISVVIGGDLDDVIARLIGVPL